MTIGFFEKTKVFFTRIELYKKN